MWTLMPKDGDYNATIFKNLGFIVNKFTFTNFRIVIKVANTTVASRSNTLEDIVI